MELLLFVVVLLALDVAAVRWGVNYTEAINSPEWNHRRERGGIL